MFVSGVRSSWEAFDTKVAFDLRKPPLFGDVPKGEEDVRARFPEVPDRRPGTSYRAAPLARRDGNVLDFGCSPFTHPSMNARAWGWRITCGYGRPATIVSEASKIFPASRFIIRTDDPRR